ncbi:electron transport complex subunit RsxE [Desulfovibrio litoralis]|uniref:Ion-translocating oxidoreductase complex subunit E n=1 Tax=Desulfovibrio litoralis DSM 11393 TaxID=1121455 RepID=A0A1M7SEH0_9BACT|nr:electron transport complex subunit E [Desulfovibrio litoralis]SHN56860.1 electron transport complex protein RnfE [Desulfovibrio litoralis DSM 11393]
MGSIWKEFSKGLWKEIPPFRLVLGLCPTLAVTKSAWNGFGMGLAVIFVLVLSNMVISSVRSIIPKKVRIVCFIALSATLVVAVELLMQAYTYTLYQQLGIFVPLIVVNCIILGRAEAFAAKNPVLLSAADGLGIGIGYTFALTFIGAIREVLGTGSLTIIGMVRDFLGFADPTKYDVLFSNFEPFRIMVEAPGAFLVLGIVLACMNWYTMWSAKKAGQDQLALDPAECGGCSGCSGCSDK